MNFDKLFFFSLFLIIFIEDLICPLLKPTEGMVIIVVRSSEKVTHLWIERQFNLFQAFIYIGSVKLKYIKKGMFPSILRNMFYPKIPYNVKHNGRR